jgi:hypothetical protein
MTPNANASKSLKLCEVKNTDGSLYGYMFRCPGCDEPHVYDARWTVTCDDPEKPSFEPSLLMNGVRSGKWKGQVCVRCSRLPLADDEECVPGKPHQYQHTCHLYLLSGQLRFLDDCTHAYAGKVIECPPWEKHEG